jgi:DAACS family dicarboxylate/amino acid:cation (Na+ or H+) symporter
MLFALVFGVAVAMTSAASEDSTLVRLLEQVFDACMWVVQIVMRTAPVAVFAIVFGASYTFGTALLAPLFLYVATVVLALAVQLFIVYGAFLRFVAGRSPAAFFRRSREVLLYAFSTASSNATLPLSMEVAVSKLGLKPDIAKFALTVGSTANQNGTALFEGVTVLFLAQVYALDLSLAQQLHVMFMSIVAGIGTAGVPGGSLPMVLVLAQSVGIPGEGMALVLGVDRFLDMCRTAVNVAGDLVIGALVNDRGTRLPATPA